MDSTTSTAPYAALLVMDSNQLEILSAIQFTQIIAVLLSAGSGFVIGKIYERYRNLQTWLRDPSKSVKIDLADSSKIKVADYAKIESAD